MADHPVCYRHSRHVWVASCPDCTDWHLAQLAASRKDRSDEPTPADDDRPSVATAA